MKVKRIKWLYRLLYIMLLTYGLSLDYASWLNQPHNEFLVYYTSQSNLLCLGMMMLLFVQTTRELLMKKESRHLLVVPQYLISIYILITCLIYNVLLGNPFSASYWTRNSYNWIVHLAGPILFILDFFLFSKAGKLKKTTPLWIIIYPYIYVLFILVRGIMLNHTYHGHIPASYVVYPYFFLDVSHLGYSGVFLWVGILTIVFIALGYLFYAIDRLKTPKAA